MTSQERLTAAARTTRGMERATTPAILVGREACADYEKSSRIEWLETNGTGGFAMGTAAGVNTRRYHGLLVAALRPPVERFVLLSKIEERICIDGHEHDLGTTQYPGVVHPQGFRLLESFRLDPFPIWTFTAAGTVVEKRLFLVQGKQIVIVQYRTNREVRLRARPFLAFRDFHALTHANDALDGRTVDERRSAEAAVMRVIPYAGLPALSLHHNGAASREGANWYYNTEYVAELERGLDCHEDLWCAGVIDFAVTPERPAWIVAATGTEGGWDGVRVASEEAVERERRRTSEREPLVARLSAAANTFCVRRADGRSTLIAGYPWFADWGRDTMIAIPGLLLARGLLDEAREVLTGFLEHIDRGLIPNRFPDRGDAPEYNTADGTLWMFHAVFEYLRFGGDPGWVHREFYPRAKEIVAWHENGTHHGIRVDGGDGLLVSGHAGTQLTWMDAKIGDWVVTPRHGKAVEINALWFNALRVMERLALELNDVRGLAKFVEAARCAGDSFGPAFWNEQRDCLYDVILPEGPDGRMRPNQIFAVSLPFSMLSSDRQQRVVAAVERSLLTPYGLRTLAPGEEGYRPRYGGDPHSRDSAYHQGTVWPWLLGPYITAYLNAFGRSRERVNHCASLLAAFEEHLEQGLLGNVAEVFDADPPHAPGGAPAQAWSVAELLRVLKVERQTCWAP
jgi:predicted glycogen debranching enzyme